MVLCLNTSNCFSSTRSKFFAQATRTHKIWPFPSWDFILIHTVFCCSCLFWRQGVTVSLGCSPGWPCTCCDLATAPPLSQYWGLRCAPGSTLLLIYLSALSVPQWAKLICILGLLLVSPLPWVFLPQFPLSAQKSAEKLPVPPLPLISLQSRGHCLTSCISLPTRTQAPCELGLCPCYFQLLLNT